MANFYVEMELTDNELYICEENATPQRFFISDDVIDNDRAFIECVSEKLKDYLNCEVDDEEDICVIDKPAVVTAFSGLSGWVKACGHWDFDPVKTYAAKPNEMKRYPPLDRQKELELMENLIADMTFGGANSEELTNVIMYSMVIIDSKKYDLAWWRAKEDFKIDHLINEYLGKAPTYRKDEYDMTNEQLKELNLKGSNAKDLKPMSYKDFCEKLAINTPKDDPVNHPSHYTDGKIEVIDFITDKRLNFQLGNAVKYICRAGKKDPSKTIEDLEKARWYLDQWIDHLKAEG